MGNIRVIGQRSRSERRTGRKLGHALLPRGGD